DRFRAAEPAGARAAVRRTGSRRLRRDDRRRERAGRGSRREPDEGEEADEHALVDCGRTRAPDPTATDVARAGAGVHRQRRVCRGNAAARAVAEGGTVSTEAANGGVAQGARAGGCDAVAACNDAPSSSERPLAQAAELLLATFPESDYKASGAAQAL